MPPGGGFAIPFVISAFMWAGIFLVLRWML